MPPRGRPFAALQRLSARPFVAAMESLGFHLVGGGGALAVVDVLTFFAAPALTTPHHLAAVALALLAVLYARMTWSRVRIRRWRRQIPLVLGGWGTRGKSGTERLKAAFIEGMGVPLLSKTTGCEAMVLHAPPGGHARELFLFRPYDKATIWEQADVLKLAVDLRARVVLWECMALNPIYVEILQRWWMRDDLSTITNAYPDHEDIQGPTGLDVATVIAGFANRTGLTLTTERNMWPVLADVTRANGGRLRYVSDVHQQLIPDDLMARMPHLEHRSNVALAASVAVELGADPIEAIALMADHVVPDLGALARFECGGPGRRQVRFINGSSANDPLSFRHNWSYTGFADRGRPPWDWQVVVTNNRGDRIPRSRIFARLIVEEAPAHRHVLIGTNVDGLLGYIDESLTARLASVDFADDTQTAELFDYLRVPDIRALSTAIAERLGVGAGVLAAWLAALPEAPSPSLEAARAAAEAVRGQALIVAADANEPELEEHLVDALARHLAFTAWPSQPPAARRSLYTDLFRASIVPLRNPATSGDGVQQTAVRGAPPGCAVRIISIQNIKGTGLDFIYQWVYLREVQQDLQRLAIPSEAEGALNRLSQQKFASRLTCQEALAALDRAELPEALRGRAAELVARIRAKHDQLAAASADAEAKPRSAARRGLERILDPLDAIRRRRAAARCFRDLARSRIGHVEAQDTLQALTNRQKGGWL